MDTGAAQRAARGSAGTAQTRWLAATTEQLLARHGVLTREAVAAESIPGGFGAIYPVLKAMDERGRVLVHQILLVEFVQHGRAMQIAIHTL